MSERISTWFIDRFTISAYVAPAGRPMRLAVLVHLVEHHDGVVQREAEDREERDDGRRGDLEAEDRVDADADEHVVDDTASSAATAILHSKRIEM